MIHFIDDTIKFLIVCILALAGCIWADAAMSAEDMAPSTRSERDARKCLSPDAMEYFLGQTDVPFGVASNGHGIVVQTTTGQQVLWMWYPSINAFCLYKGKEI